MAIEPGEPGIALQQGAVGDGVRFRAGSTEPGGGNIDQIGIDATQSFGAEAQPIHDAGREVLDQHVGFGGQCPSDCDGFRLLEIEDDRFFAWPSTVCNSDARPGSPRPGASTLMTSAPIAARWRVVVGPAMTQLKSRTRIPESGIGPGSACSSAPARFHDPQPEGWSGSLDCFSADLRSGARICGARAAATSVVRPARATGSSAHGPPAPYRRSIACRAGGSTPTSAHAAHSSLPRGPVLSQNADRCPNRATP